MTRLEIKAFDTIIRSMMEIVMREKGGINEKLSIELHEIRVKISDLKQHLEDHCHLATK